MTGTSLDAIDLAMMRTDGEHLVELGPTTEIKLSARTRGLIEAATLDASEWNPGSAEPSSFGPARDAITELHVSATRKFLVRSPWAISLIGAHGQTVLHRASSGDRTGCSVQLLDARRLAEETGIAVVHDFRRDDIESGGQGAPLTPIYHAALAAKTGLKPPIGILNLGGIANLTLVRSDGGLEALDTGPANGMIDLLMQSRTGKWLDLDGATAAAGQVDRTVLAAYLAHPFFAVAGPKSLDRFDFSLDPVARLDLPDAAATLVAFAAAAVAKAISMCAEKPTLVAVVGGGRHNPVLLSEITSCAQLPVVKAEEVGWRGDSVEAEAFAYLAARSVRHLPISFPQTTGTNRPRSGGTLVPARADERRGVHRNARLIQER